MHVIIIFSLAGMFLAVSTIMSRLCRARAV
jgi:hypothetical protein